jgi:hypothetical protein
MREHGRLLSTVASILGLKWPKNQIISIASIGAHEPMVGMKTGVASTAVFSIDKAIRI